MFSIKKSFADCMSCSLLNEPSCILETNCKDLEDVEIIFISEFPSKDEIKKEKPLSGKSNILFRKYFEKYKINDMKYLLTNNILCQTEIPELNVIENCKENCFNFIKTCKPKLIVLMGDIPANTFQVLPKNSNIVNIRGNFFKWENYDVLLTLNPSFINKQKTLEEKFEEDIKKAAEFILGSTIKGEEKINQSILGNEGIHYYKIPDKFYTDEYKLVDIQMLNKANKVLYIFRDKNNKKIYHEENDDYYCYQPKEGIPNKKVLKFDEIKQVMVKYKEKAILDPSITYDGDIKLPVKHAHDYYFLNKGEANVPLNIMHLDIETFCESKSYSNAVDVKDILAMITYWLNGKYVTYMIDNKILLKDPNAENVTESAILCKSEKELITRFRDDLLKLDPDILSGWNSIGFDFPYIINRAAKLGIIPASFSKYGEIYVDADRRFCDISGFICLDMLDLYKNYSQKKPENNRLGTVGLFELKQDKLDSGSNFGKLFKENVNQSIRYNVRDVSLLVDLDKKLKHIFLMNEMREITNGTFNSAANEMGKVDSIIVSYLKRKGLVSRNADIHGVEQKFAGAFVKETITGLHEWIVDFDFTSLYPSIMMTMNIGPDSFVFKFKDKTHGYDYLYDFNNLPDEVDIIIDPDFTAIEKRLTKQDVKKLQEKDDLIMTINGCFYYQHDYKKSFYNEIEEYLLKSRKVYKNKMFEAEKVKDDESVSLYNVRQLVYKVLANAIYGVQGNKAFRFFNVDLAESITLTGQEALKFSIMAANNMVDSWKTKNHILPELITKQEMYGNLSRNTEYIITGDTDSLFVTYGKIINKKMSQEDKVKQVNEYCVLLQNFLNKDIIEKLTLIHNVKPENNKLFLKNELIIQRGLFVSKKHYALHIISNEGVQMDTIKSMGLDVKRSDFSRYTKECLTELIELILKSENFSPSRVRQFIENREKEFIIRIQNGDKSVAKPASFTKDVDDYKVISQNVHSMINWNNLEYNIFAHGSKGYLFKINGIKQDIAPKEVLEKYNNEFLSKGTKLEVISLPDEELSLPKYYSVNVKAMLEFAWKDRYELLLEPIIGKDTQVLTF